MSNVDSRSATNPRTATDGKAPVFGRRDVLGFGALSGGMLALSPFLAACESDAAPALTPQRGGRLRFAGAGVQSETKNVFNTNSPQEIARNRHLFDWVGYMEGGKPVPYIVESIESADDVSRWRMRIRKEARFSDGSPVTADDVLFSLHSASDPKIGGGLLSAAAASIDFKASRTVGKDVVELRLTEPLADMDTQIYAGKVYVIKAGSHLGKPESFTVDNVVGSGPYTLADLKVGQSAKLAMNENYWGRGLLGGGPYLSEIEVFNIPDPTARLNALLGGQADLAAKLDYAGAKVNASNSAFSFTKTDRVYANEGCFIMNSRKKPFDDPRVRLAFKLACQREALVKGALLGYGSVANDLQGVGFPDYYGDELPQRAYDPAQAQALLRQAGVAGETVEISVFPGVGTAAAAQIYAEQLGKVGMKARVREITPPELFKNFPTFSNIQVLAVAVPGNQPFATSVAPRSLVSKSTFNVAGWLDRDWDRRLLAARATADQAKRKKLMLRLQTEFWDDSGWIVWGYQTIVNGTTSSVHGVGLDGVEDAPSIRKAWKS